MLQYNGCLWKGGRLKLEKAKEHYLERLKREWAEDAEPPAKPVAVDTHIDPCSSNKSNRMTNDKAQLQIFFPKLRKVNSRKSLSLASLGSLTDLDGAHYLFYAGYRLKETSLCIAECFTFSRIFILRWFDALFIDK